MPAEKVFLIGLTLFYINGQAQVRDTLKLTITRVERQIKTDTVYMFSSRVDTIALQPIKTDTSKVAKDINPLDLAESKYQIKFMGSIRANAYYDFTGMPSTEGFMPYDIPVGEDAIDGLSSIYAGARQSRIRCGRQCKYTGRKNKNLYRS